MIEKQLDIDNLKSMYQSYMMDFDCKPINEKKTMSMAQTKWEHSLNRRKRYTVETAIILLTALIYLLWISDYSVAFYLFLGFVIVYCVYVSVLQNRLYNDLTFEDDVLTTAIKMKKIKRKNIIRIIAAIPMAFILAGWWNFESKGFSIISFKEISFDWKSVLYTAIVVVVAIAITMIIETLECKRFNDIIRQIRE